MMVPLDTMTEEQRKMWDQLVMLIIYGLEKGVWDMLAEASLAMTNTVGVEMLRFMEEKGLTVEGKTPAELMKEVGERFVSDMGIADAFDITKEDSSVGLQVQGCVLMEVEARLVEQGIKPFMCPFLNIAMAALRKQTGGATSITQFDVDPKQHRCLLKFRLLE